MKRCISVFLALVMVLLSFSSCHRRNGGRPPRDGEDTSPVEILATVSGAYNITVTVGDKDFNAVLFDGEAADELYGMLPLTISMSDQNNNEKFGTLPSELTDNDDTPGNISAGDIMLYGDDYLVMFYKSFESSYRYTPLGKIADGAGFAAAVGDGNVHITLSPADDGE